MPRPEKRKLSAAHVFTHSGVYYHIPILDLPEHPPDQALSANRFRRSVLPGRRTGLRRRRGSGSRRKRMTCERSPLPGPGRKAKIYFWAAVRSFFFFRPAQRFAQGNGSLGDLTSSSVKRLVSQTSRAVRAGPRAFGTVVQSWHITVIG
jgi:hypothetical protein